MLEILPGAHRFLSEHSLLDIEFEYERNFVSARHSAKLYGVYVLGVFLYISAAMPKDTVKLISAEGFEFIIDYKAACISNTIKNMLSSDGMLECHVMRKNQSPIIDEFLPLRLMLACHCTVTSRGEFRAPTLNPWSRPSFLQLVVTFLLWQFNNRIRVEY